MFQYRDGQPVIEQYQPGEAVEFRMRFDRPVKVDESNPPWVNLSINSGGPARADYDATRTAANFEPNLLSFTHVVQDGDRDDDGIWAGPDSLQNPGSITDYAGNVAAGGGLGRNTGHNVGDSGAPTIVDLEFTSRPLYGGRYQPGETIEITVTASEPLIVDGSNPPHLQLKLQVGNLPPRAQYDAVRSQLAGANKMVFTWAVVAGYQDDDGIFIDRDYLDRTNGVKDWSHNATSDRLPKTYGNDPRHKVGDLGAPVITNVEMSSKAICGGTYRAGETLEFTLTVSEPVTVPVGDDGIFIDRDYLDRTNGVKDWSHNATSDRLPKTYGNDPRHKVGDLGAPVITNVEMSSKAICGGTYRAGETLEFTLTVSEPVTVPVGNEPRLIIRVGDDYRSVAYDRVSSQSAGANHMTFAWEVPAGFQAREGILLGPGALGDTGSIEDGSANPLDPSLHKYWGFDGNQVGGPANYFTVDVSNSTPQAGERVTLTLQLEAGCTGVESYQWQRQSGGNWRDVGPRTATKEPKFNSPPTVKYRAVVRFISGATVTSQPVSITWRWHRNDRWYDRMTR